MKWRFLYRGFKARYLNQRLEVGTLVAALRADAVAVDVGANKGSYLWALSRAVPRGRVVAFEPQPALAEYLTRACQVSGLRNVTIVPSGVSKQTGTLRLAIPGAGDSSPGASFESVVAQRETCRFVDVPVCTLDTYFQSEKARIGALKIDVEGHELSVLQGATELLKAHRPVIVCECEQRHLTTGTVADVIQYVEAQNYQGYFVKNAHLHPVREFSPAQHQKQLGARFWDALDYCNNFIFQPLA